MVKQLYGASSDLVVQLEIRIGNLRFVLSYDTSVFLPVVYYHGIPNFGFSPILWSCNLVLFFGSSMEFGQFFFFFFFVIWEWRNKGGTLMLNRIWDWFWILQAISFDVFLIQIWWYYFAFQITGAMAIGQIAIKYCFGRDQSDN